MGDIIVPSNVCNHPIAGIKKRKPNYQITISGVSDFVDDQSLRNSISIKKGSNRQLNEVGFDDVSDFLSHNEGLLSQASGYKSSLNHYSVLHPKK